MGIKSVKVGLNFGVASLEGVWEPSALERKAAWELYVEMVTQISVVPLGPEQGTMRAALSSLHSLFDVTREILRRYGPKISPIRTEGHFTFGQLAITALNWELRPFLARWHPLLDDWHATKPSGKGPLEHEQDWRHTTALRAEFESTRQRLQAYAQLLADIAGVPHSSNYSHPEE